MMFSDSGDLQGAIDDSNSGVDYHVPISGSSARPPPLRVAHVSVEMAPIAKVRCLLQPWKTQIFPYPAVRHSC